MHLVRRVGRYALHCWLIQLLQLTLPLLNVLVQFVILLLNTLALLHHQLVLFEEVLTG